MPKKIELTRTQWARYAARVRWKKNREAILLECVPIVERIARQVHRHMTHVSIEDLIQSGYVGLLEADRLFDPAKGKTFQAFSYFRIRGAMIDAHKRRAYKDDTLSLVTIDESGVGESHIEMADPRKVAAIRIVRDNAPMPEETAQKREQAYLLSQAVQELPEDERQVFTMSVGGASLIAIAEKRGRSVAWARAKLASARATLGAKVVMWGMGLDKAA